MATRDFPAVSLEDFIKPTKNYQGKLAVSPDVLKSTPSDTASIFTADVSAAAMSSRTTSPDTPAPPPERQPWGSDYKCRATQLTPRFDLLLSGEPVGYDGEFQNFKHVDDIKWKHRAGRSAFVNMEGEVVLDVYSAYPKEEGVRKMMPRINRQDVFGVDHQDFLFRNGAVAAHTVEKWIAEIVKDRPVVVHDARGDLSALQYEKDAFAKASKIIDTQQEYYHLQPRGNGPSLALCASVVLGEMVQVGGHSPVEDAWTTVKLYKQLYAYDREAEEARIRAEEVAAGVDVGAKNKKPAPDHEPTPRRFHGERRMRNRAQPRESTDPISGRAVRTLKQDTRKKVVKEVEEFNLSIDDNAAFPALGGMPGKNRR